MTYAILYRFGSLVVRGRGFAAEVEASGRALVEHGGGRWRLRTLEMGGLDADGDEPHEAFARLRSRLLSRLFALASESRDYTAFAHSAALAFDTAATAEERRFHDCLSAIGPAPRREQAGETGTASLRVAPVQVERPADPGDNHLDAMIVLDRRSWTPPAWTAPDRRR